jgi:xanthine dehydrogenase accessory factor
MGDSLLVLPSGEIVGDDIPPSLLDTLSGAARKLLESPWSEPQALTLPGEAGEAYFEPILLKSSLLIVGAGHIGEALSRLAARLDFEVAILDDRPSLVTPERFPDASQFHAEDIAAALRGMTFRTEDSVIVVTRGHQHDGDALREVANSGAGYVGMIGSRRKVHLIFQELLEEGYATSEQLRRVRSPIGLDIGAKSVEEIALSIAAELVAVRAKIRAGADPLAIFPDEEGYSPMSARRSPKSIRRDDSMQEAP